jgi:phenol 2-monooxygenase/3-hydroxybenzoate 4-monooxygenase
MQFHLNGFRPGDPRVAEAAPGLPAFDPDRPPSHVDVLIVGAGPAGLTLAAQLAAFGDIRACIVEQKPGPLQLGQADGIACRTMEMFQAFGFAGRVLEEACWINEVRFWKPDDAAPGRVVRHARVPDVEEGLSEFPHVVLNQARVHDFFLETMRQAPARLQPHHGWRVLGMTRDDAAPGGHPIAVQLQRCAADPAADPAAGGVEAAGRAATSSTSTTTTVHARHVVGCDGAHSTVRRAIGLALEGEQSNQAWGVMDLLADTDFPDIRCKAAVQSLHGNLLVIPREGGYLVRLYVELDKLAAGERIARNRITLERLVEAARRILQPYTLHVRQVPWWSVYEIGQRLAPRFDDAAGERREPRVFIAGDACHTHSPKAGQGMNVSMQDAFNLGWKLAAVLRGRASPALLRTYSAERHAVAHDLIAFDREWARLFSEAPAVRNGGTDGVVRRPQASDAPNGSGVDPEQLRAYFQRHLRYTAGVMTRYAPSIAIGDDRHQALARGFEVGTRFHSAPVIRVADMRPMQLGHCGGADGRFRLYAFAGAGDRGGAGQPLHALCSWLADAPESPLVRTRRRDDDPDAFIDLRAVFAHEAGELDLPAMHPLLHPVKGALALHDLEKVFAVDTRPGMDIHAQRSIDRAQGALVVVRPDQVVAAVLPLAAHAELARLFDRLLFTPDGAVPDGLV